MAVRGRLAGGWWRSPAVAVLVGLGYALGAGCAWILFHASAVAVFYPPAGVTLGALLLTSRRRWPWVLGAAAVVELAVDVWQGQRVPVALGFVAANVMEPLVGAALLRRWLPGSISVTRRSDALLFLACCVGAGPLAGALLGASTITIGLGRGFWGSFGPYWAGDALAVLTLGLAVTAGRRVSGRSVARAALVLVAMAAVTVVGFLPYEVPLSYLPVPLLIALGFRSRVATIAAAGFVMAFVANLMTAAGRGPWAALSQQPRLEAATLQVYLALAVLGAWMLAIAVVERDDARATSARETAARRRLEALQDVTAALATAATTEQIAEVLAERGVAPLADVGTVALIDRRGGSVRLWHTGQPGRARTVPLADPNPESAMEVARTGRVISLGTAAEVAAWYPHPGPATGLGALLALPVRRGDRTIGALTFGFRDPRTLGDEVAAMAQTLAALAVQSLERAQLYEAEHEAAHELQRALLPRIATDLPGARVGVCYRPAERGHDVGGDWYDAFELPGHRVGFAVGDVVGHDLQAATAMGRLQHVLRSAALSGSEPAEVLEALDEASPAIPGADCATVGYAEYSAADGTLTYACAGHPPPLLVMDGRARFLMDGRSQPLRVRGRPRSQARVGCPPGAMLVWYSDGLVERRTRTIDRGLEELTRLAAQLTGDEPQAWCDALLKGMTDGETVADDVVVACLRLEGATVLTRDSSVLRRSLKTAEELQEVRADLRTWAAREGMPQRHADALVTVCAEALKNGLEHAYEDRPGGGTVDLRVLRVDSRHVRVEVRDHGIWRGGHGLAVINRTAASVRLDLSTDGTCLTATLPG
ncbi:SpoIIE family protein phosphatase [Actinoplanes sp. NPDC049316]|uniref:SpoIIE family protein phosphatase n=1 Tax=Actinoplanes sp. NPDC049316 TaxID=3154727 RepID=UPI00342F08B0